MTSVTTKTGDKGLTGLFGGQRVSKASERLHAYGTVDELNAVLGVTRSELDLPHERRSELAIIQRRLFTVGADLATPLESKAVVPRVGTADVDLLESWVHIIEAQLPIQTKFLMPAGSRAGSLLHLARTVCRRAERHVVGLAQSEAVNDSVQIYLNRLSDYLFVAARWVNRHVGAKEEEV